MNKVRIFLVTCVLWLIMGFAVYGVICTATGNVALAKMQEPGCKDFATTGNIQLYRCVDETGRVWMANSMGFISYGGN